MYCLCRLLFYVLFVCKCELYYRHWVSTQLQLNIYHIISNKNTNLKTHAVFMFCVSHFNNVRGWGYFREIRNPVWRLLQLGVLGERISRQLVFVVSSTQISGNNATGPVNCRSRRQAAEQRRQSAVTAGFQATKVSSNLSLY